MNVPAIIFGGLTGFTAIATVWFGTETILLATGHEPITWYVRNYTSWHLGVFAVAIALAGVALGAGAAHFWWDAPAMASARAALAARLR